MVLEEYGSYSVYSELKMEGFQLRRFIQVHSQPRVWSVLEPSCICGRVPSDIDSGLWLWILDPSLHISFKSSELQRSSWSLEGWSFELRLHSLKNGFSYLFWELNRILLHSFYSALICTMIVMSLISLLKPLW